MMKVFLLCAFLLMTAMTAYPQRCGDSLLLYLRDQRGRILTPSDFSSARVSAAYTVENVSDLRDAELKTKELPPGIKSFSVRVECGMKWAEFKLEREGTKMIIRVLNVPGDAQHILLDGILFRVGTYGVDLGGRPLKNVETHQGEGSEAADPADEIKWLIKDKSLSKVN